MTDVVYAVNIVEMTQNIVMQ